MNPEFVRKDPNVGDERSEDIGQNSEHTHSEPADIRRKQFIRVSVHVSDQVASNENNTNFWLNRYDKDLLTSKGNK
jgi:hypothetical protein